MPWLPPHPQTSDIPYARAIRCALQFVGSADTSTAYFARRSNGPATMRILIVEDHHDSLEAMQRLLARHNHDITAATTLSDAVRLCINGKFDLVICDIGLPDGEGWELASVARTCGASGSWALVIHTFRRTPVETLHGRRLAFRHHAGGPGRFAIDAGNTASAIARLISPNSNSPFAAYRDELNCCYPQMNADEHRSFIIPDADTTAHLRRVSIDCASAATRLLHTHHGATCDNGSAD